MLVIDVLKTNHLLVLIEHEDWDMKMSKIEKRIQIKLFLIFI
jgi:hypothetical protein